VPVEVERPPMDLFKAIFEDSSNSEMEKSSSEDEQTMPEVERKVFDPVDDSQKQSTTTYALSDVKPILTSALPTSVRPGFSHMLMGLYLSCIVYFCE